MSKPTQSNAERFAELQRLIAARAELAMTAEQAARLEHLVTTNPAARRMYVEYMLDSCSLHWWAGCEHAPPAAVPPLAGTLSAPVGETPIAFDANPDNAGGFLPGAMFSSRWFTLFAVVVVFCGLGIGGLAIRDFRPQRAELAAQKSDNEIAHGRVNAVRLESGITKLTLDKIGTVIVEGPSDFELIGPMRARLTRGRIRMHVTETSGQGFVIETPNGEVTDLGTEFGIDVSKDLDTGVVVFQGSVDLAVPTKGAGQGEARIERLVQGEGLSVNGEGQLGRIMSIVTGGVATFRASDEAVSEPADRIIAHVADNIRELSLKNFYEIVPKGMKEDALIYAVRPEHDWNGVDERGMPAYLIGADYVKTFNDDKMRRDVNLFVTLARPARLFVLLDDRVSPPDWLVRDFEDTGDDIGLDAGAYSANGAQYTFARATGPGKSLDAVFSVWSRDIPEPGVITLGPNLGASGFTGMYAIAAVALAEQLSPSSQAVSQAGLRDQLGHNSSASR